MAEQITRLLPYRNIDEHDVYNEYAFDGAVGEAGTFVKVTKGDLSAEPVEYVNSKFFLNKLGNATSQYPTVPNRVDVAGTGDGQAAIGILLRDIREVDENGEKLHFYPQKREELQCLLSGEAVPIATRGIVDLNYRGLAGGVVPNVNDKAVLVDNGQVTGVAASDLTAAQKDDVVGTFIGTGSRVSQQTADAFEGAYARLKFSL